MFAIRTILCPTDFSEPSETAVRAAEHLARDCGAKLILLHVAELPPMIADEAVLMHPADFDPDRERERLEAVAIDSTVEVERDFVLGVAPDDILRVARERGCDLIVIGTHGRTGLSRLVMGSVAEAVIRKAPCPVLSVRPDACPVARVAETVAAAG